MSQVILKNIRDKASPLVVSYGFADTQFGEIILGLLNVNENKSDLATICHLHFVNLPKSSSIKYLQDRFPLAAFVENTTLAQHMAKTIFDSRQQKEQIQVAISGTTFQQVVWETLLKILPGQKCTYSDVAEMMDKPKAVRAVANAIANNEVAVLIPCHRVVAKGGNQLKYRWGGERKQKLLEYEFEK